CRNWASYDGQWLGPIVVPYAPHYEPTSRKSEATSAANNQPPRFLDAERMQRHPELSNQHRPSRKYQHGLARTKGGVNRNLASRNRPNESSLATAGDGGGR